ncbi:MAG TPA: RagB/SusD family nutrient uptake outer membrane protein [Gemmatimonadaceae bacterium]|nr:RagB/SusD family nutrient uptake outer membrane protein [Gemmatimonadaceae bacterium]
MDIMNIQSLARRAGALGAMALALTACDKLLEVDSPSRIPAETIEDPAYADLLVNSVVADFECALGSYAVLGGLIGEELDDATQTADRYPYDIRNAQPTDRRYAVNACQDLGVYAPLQTARVTASNAARFLSGWSDAQVPDRQAKLAIVRAYEGYAILLLGEGFCSTVLSTFDADGNPVYGTEITPAQAFAEAEARFTEVIDATPAPPDSVRNMALVGRARARLNQGNFTGARADAALVPAAYVKLASASDDDARRRNRAWAQNSATSTATSVGAPYRNLNDPRVPVLNTGTNGPTGIPLWRQLKYPEAESPFRLASGEEARLIVAEAAIQANTPADLLTATTIINEFRAQGNQTQLVAPTQAELRAALIDQRRRELYLEGQHLYDLIRFNLPFDPAVGTTFPGGGTYGNVRCLPLPNTERFNNPNLG